jgi:hypothetical protein
MDHEEKYRFKLEEISRENVFKTPEGYFESLPLAIQNKMSARTSDSGIHVWTLALKYAVPMIIVMISFLLWINTPFHKSPEQLIAQVGEASIMEYLQLSDLTANDILLSIEKNQLNLHLEDANFLDHLQIEDRLMDLFEEYGINNL